MGNKLRIAVADDEEIICTMLTKMIDYNELGIELVGTAQDGDALMELIERERPDIVVTDISMPKADGLKVVADTQQKGIKCKFIIVSGYTQFEYAYNALKYDVKDYLLKPINRDELNLAIKKTINDLNSSGELENYTGTLHSFFIRNAVANPDGDGVPKSISAVNNVYSLNIREGAMRIALFRLDISGAAGKTEHDVTSVISKFTDIFSKHMKPLCSEVVFDSDEMSVTTFINYDPADEERVQEEIEQAFVEIKNVVGIFALMYPTLCVGDRVGDMSSLYRSFISAKQALWTRRASRLGKVIYHNSDDGIVPQELEKKLAELAQKYDRALVALDSRGLTQAIDELFAMPDKLLRKEAVRLFVSRCVDSLGEKTGEFAGELPDYDSIEEIYTSLVAEAENCTDYPQLRDTIKRRIRDIVFHISRGLEKKPFSPIRVAYRFIDRNYDKPISLNDVAEAANLSPAYFSVLFKKETGVSLMEYITDIRIDKAKEYLRETDMNINEIAYALSFQDARYFSKLFKKKVGIKPSDYRKIYS